MLYFFYMDLLGYFFALAIECLFLVFFWHRLRVLILHITLFSHYVIIILQKALKRVGCRISFPECSSPKLP